MVLPEAIHQECGFARDWCMVGRDSHVGGTGRVRIVPCERNSAGMSSFGAGCLDPLVALHYLAVA